MECHLIRFVLVIEHVFVHCGEWDFDAAEAVVGYGGGAKVDLEMTAKKALDLGSGYWFLTANQKFQSSETA